MQDGPWRENLRQRDLEQAEQRKIRTLNSKKLVNSDTVEVEVISKEQGDKEATTANGDRRQRHERDSRRKGNGDG